MVLAELLLKQEQRLPREGYSMRLFRLHPASRNCPDCAREIHLIPSHPSDLPGTGGSEDKKEHRSPCDVQIRRAVKL